MLALLLLGTQAYAGSISAPGVIGGPDSGAATPNVAATFYNPAALAAAKGVQVMADVQVAAIRVDATTTRNDGIDPNTGEAYTVAQARVKVPVALLGASWQVIPDRLTVGLAVTDAFVGGGNYLAGEPDEEPPYESHQRYAGVETTVLTLHVIPAVGVRVADGVAVGAGFKYIVDSFDTTLASDPLGTEGVGPDGPYTADSILTGEMSGGHIGFNGGVFVDRWQKAQVGLGVNYNGTFKAEGDGQVIAPTLLGGGTPAAKLDISLPLPVVAQLWVNSAITEQLTVGGGVEAQLWGLCCSDHDGDATIGVLSEDGDAIGADPEDGIAVSIAETIYSPRRLNNSYNFGLNGGYQAHEHLWVGTRLAYNTHAVPDYAVSATNIDYTNVGAYLAARATFGPMQVGLSYAKYLPFERTITNSAWDAAEDSADYVDEYLSPKNPYKASANGTYHTKVDIVGVRIGATF